LLSSASAVVSAISFLDRPCQRETRLHQVDRDDRASRGGVEADRPAQLRVPEVAEGRIAGPAALDEAQEVVAALGDRDVAVVGQHHDLGVVRHRLRRRAARQRDLVVLRHQVLRQRRHRGVGLGGRGQRKCGQRQERGDAREGQGGHGTLRGLRRCRSVAKTGAGRHRR
jgi:hypothetical protein